MTLNYLSPNKLNIKNHLAMLPCGDLADHNIKNWTASDLEPYVSYVLKGKSIDTMFGGLIFNPISTRENHYIYPLYATLGNLADKVDWQLAIDNFFKKNVNYHAATLSKRQLDIWVVLPYPLSLQTNFGLINNINLNFEQENDRFLALEWWIKSFLERWRKESHLHSTLTFKGFTWQRDAINHQDSLLVKKANNYIHTQNLLTMWLPNYGSNSIIDWQKLGFSTTCINSNYYGNTSYDYKWINHASVFAKFHHTGMQIYYGKGSIFNDVHLLDYLNLGLPQYNNYMKDCLVVYHFPNQNLKTIYEKDVVAYIRIYSFIKGIYSKVSYPNIKY